MKKTVALLIVALLLCSIVPITVAEQNTVQEYVISPVNSSTVEIGPKEPASFWERPTLRGGDHTDRSGTLLIRNQTNQPQRVALRAVELPYENEQALAYLSHLNIRIYNVDQVFYDGPYSMINYSTDFTLEQVLEPGGIVGYSVELSCDYAYTGEGFTGEDVINWSFHAEPIVTETVTEPAEKTTAFADPALLELILACGIAIIVLVGVFIYDRLAKR